MSAFMVDDTMAGRRQTKRAGRPLVGLRQWPLRCNRACEEHTKADDDEILPDASR